MLHRILIGLFLISVMFITIVLNPYDKKDPYDKKENFESSIMSNLKSNYRRKKRKAKMIKDGFTSDLNYKVKHFARQNNL